MITTSGQIQRGQIQRSSEPPSHAASRAAGAWNPPQHLFRAGTCDSAKHGAGPRPHTSAGRRGRTRYMARRRCGGGCQARPGPSPGLLAWPVIAPQRRDFAAAASGECMSISAEPSRLRPEASAYLMSQARRTKHRSYQVKYLDVHAIFVCDLIGPITHGFRVNIHETLTLSSKSTLTFYQLYAIHNSNFEVLQ